MKKIEVCAPVTLIEPFRAELASAGLLTSAGVTMSCSLLEVGEVKPRQGKTRANHGATHCKIELLVSDRLANRAIEIVSDFFDASGSEVDSAHLVVLDVQGTYKFERSAKPITPSPS